MGLWDCIDDDDDADGLMMVVDDCWHGGNGKVDQVYEWLWALLAAGHEQQDR